MKPIVQIAPLALLFIGAVLVVWRGMRRRPDSSKNRSGGGGSAFPGKNTRW